MHQKSCDILRLFRSESGFVSGEAVSRELGVSRTAVWKHISTLRRAGYRIEAVPSRGYRLLSAPDILDSQEIAATLDGIRIGRRLECLQQTASTNADALRLAEGGAAEGSVVIADAQTDGKGRRGRVWSSPAGVNLYCSIILRPPILPHEAPQLTFLSAVAVAQAIEQNSLCRPAIKWPNDVLIDGKKIAGLLNEMSAETDAINCVVLGIGVNLNMTADQFPTDLRSPATSLLIESGMRVDRSRFAASLLNALDRLYSGFLAAGFGPVREEWQRRCNATERRMVMSEGGIDRVSGLFSGIDTDGSLLLQTDEGVMERIISGDVRIV